MPLKCSTHIAPADVPCIRPPAPPVPESQRLPVMTVNGMRPDANGNVLVVILGMADVAAEVAKETERAKAEEAKNASAAKTAAAKADEAQTSLDDHVANAHNPHNVTAAQVGALPVNNTDEALKFGILTGNGISLAGTFYDDTDPRMVKLRFAEASYFGSGLEVRGRISLGKNSEFPEYGNGELLVDGVNVMDAIDSKAGKTELASKADIVDGKVPAAQLPSFVDDVLEYDALSAFPATGETGKIYVAKDTNKTYRWGGTQYVEISQSLALGETADTAYPGDKGKAAADSLKNHVENKSNPHAVTAEQVGAVALVEDADGAKTAATIGVLKSSAPIGAFSLANGTLVTASGHSSHAEGDNTTASGVSSHAEGTYTTALGEYSHSEGNYTTAAGVCSHAEGEETRADGHASHAEGYRSHARVGDAYSFAWNGDDSILSEYLSHGKGTFNVNPIGGSEGFYVGEKKLSEVISELVANKADKAALRYALGSPLTASGTLSDRTINLVQVGATDIDLALPEARTDGTARDLLVRIEMASDATGTPSIALPESWDGDTIPAFAAGKNYLLTLTETKAEAWYVRVIELTTVSPSA